MIPRENISEELFTISQSVANVPRGPVFTVPESYFDAFPERILAIIRAGDAVQVSEETASISPILGSLDRKMPFTVPDGYFEQLAQQARSSVRPVAPQPARVVSLFGNVNPWKLAAAAVVTGFIALSAWFFLKEKPLDTAAFAMNIHSELPKLSDQEINNFLVAFPDLEESEAAPTAGLENLDVEAMLKDMKEGELQQYIADKPDLRAESLN